MKQVLGQRIKHYRELKSISQSDLASAMGAHKQTVSGWENGRSWPEYDKLEAISSVLGIQIENLLENIMGSPPPTSSNDALAAAARAIEIASALGPDIVARLGSIFASGDDNKAESIRSFLKAHLTGLESEGEPENQTLHADNQQTKPREKSPKRK